MECLVNKKYEFLHFIEDSNPDIFLIRETWLKPCIPFRITNYILNRTDRLNGKASVVGILIKTNISHNRLNNFPTFTENAVKEICQTTPNFLFMLTVINMDMLCLVQLNQSSEKPINVANFSPKTFVYCCQQVDGR